MEREVQNDLHCSMGVAEVFTEFSTMRHHLGNRLSSSFSSYHSYEVSKIIAHVHGSLPLLHCHVYMPSIDIHPCPERIFRAAVRQPAQKHSKHWWEDTDENNQQFQEATWQDYGCKTA